MQEHRKLPDGSLRSSDNWQKGIPYESYVASLWRHFLEVWLWRREGGPLDAVEDALCAVIFNAQGLLYEILKARHGPRSQVAHLDEK